MSNKTLLQKADLAISDLQATGGVLPEEESNSFIRKMIAQPTLLNQVRTVEMLSDKRKINKIGFGRRILRKAVSATALTQSQRVKPTTEQLTITTEEQIAEVRLPYDTVETAIERATVANNEASNTGPGGFRQTIIDLIAQRAALDLEELALKGDVTYTNANDQDDEDYLSQMDGYLKIASTRGHVVDANGQVINKGIFKTAIQTIPIQYQRNLASMRYYVSHGNETEYRDTLSDRGTGLGDRMVEGRDPLYAYGVPIEAVALMPENRALFTNPLNLIFGIQRNISMEFDKDITARVYIIVLTTKIGFEIEEADALVTVEDIGAWNV